MKISIKEPCHENWNEMTPNQQGAFCGKCVKTVVDFSTKTIDEIKDFFNSKNDEKICGRFETTQLTSLNFDDFYSKFRGFHLSKRVAFVVCLTFGAWLFGLDNVKAQTKPHKQNTEVHLKGDIAYVPEKKDTIKKCVKPPPTEKQMIMGKVLPPKQPLKNSKTIIKPKPIRNHVMGESMAEPVTQPISEKQYLMGAAIAEPTKTIEQPATNPKKIEPKKK